MLKKKNLDTYKQARREADESTKQMFAGREQDFKT